MSTKSLCGCSFIFGIADVATGMLFLYNEKTKDEAPADLDRFIKEEVLPRGRTVKLIHADQDSVFKGVTFRTVCNNHGIRQRFSAPYSSHQAGMIERRWRTISSSALTMMIYAGLDKRHWALAMSAATYVRNRVILVRHTAKHPASPYVLLDGKIPDLSHLR